MGLTSWLERLLKRVGGAARFLPCLWLLAAAICLLASAWLLVRVWHAGEPPAAADWQQAASRMASRIGPGEIIFVHPAGRTAQAIDSVAGLPVACDPWEGSLTLSGKLPAGIWVAGDRALPGRLKTLLAGFSRKGTIGFGKVFLRHHWKRAEKPPRKR